MSRATLRLVPKDERRGSEGSSIERKVAEAVGEAELEIEGLLDSMPAGRQSHLNPPGEHESLELADVRRHKAPEAPPRGTRRPGRGTWFIVAVIVVAGGAGMFAYLQLSPRDRGIITQQLKRAPAKLADIVPKHELYTFVDDDGVVHIVDAIEKVPEKYRARARRTRPE